MTVSSETSRVEYAGNGTTTAFTVPFYFLANGDLLVYQAGTLKTITTHYSVSGAGSLSGGTVTFVTAPASGDDVVILRDPALTQTTDYTPNDPFPAESHERALDRLTMIAQRSRDLVDRSLRLDDSEAGGADMTLPALADRANKTFYWDSNGEPTTADVSATTVTFSPVVQTFSGDGATTAFTLSEAPGTAAALVVAISGVVQVPGTDFTVSSTTLTFGSAPPSGTGNIVAQNFGIARAVNSMDASGVTYTPDGSGAVPTTVQTKLREFDEIIVRYGSADYSYRIGIASGDMDETVRGSVLFVDGWDSYPNLLGVNNSKPAVDPSTGARSADSSYVAGTAEVAAILAGYDNVNNALAGLIASQHSMLYTGADHASIWGGSLHTINDDTHYSTIVGGTQNTIEARGRYAVILAGDKNKIETGATDAESGFRSAIVASSECTANGRNAVILASLSSSIASTYGTIFAGESIILTNGSHMGAGGNTITMGASSASTYSFAWGYGHTIDGARSMAFGEGHVVGSGHDYSSALGYRVKTPCIGAHVFSARHRGGTAGNNQAVDLTCSQETTDTTTTRLSVAGSANYPTQPESSIVHGTVWVTGVNLSTGASSSFQIDFVSERITTGTPTLRANVTATIYNGLALGTVPTMNTTSGGIYRVQVVGLAATNIAWDARIVAQQVVYA